VRDKVNLLAGGDLHAERDGDGAACDRAKVPVHHHERGHGPLITTRSPYIARCLFSPCGSPAIRRPMGGEEIKRGSTRW